MGRDLGKTRWMALSRSRHDAAAGLVRHETTAVVEVTSATVTSEITAVSPQGVPAATGSRAALAK